MKNNPLLIFAALLTALFSCRSADAAGDGVLPVTGTWINLAYQDGRNKYTNPFGVDGTDPEMWAEKVRELHGMGVEYLVFMAVANEGKAFYPSGMMPHAYPDGRKSPVDAIMDEAGKLGMKVFMSIGWAEDQDDNLRNPEIRRKQTKIMEELCGLYKDHRAMFGWYLPVEDCLGPVLGDHAVDAVNSLADHARELAPHKKILVSPYGIFNSDFDDPRYAVQIGRLKVDIIAYQDEVGCVREQFPLPRLRKNWKRLREIHDGTGIEMWANCETFTWEKGTNSRKSALIPCDFSRLLAQMAAASEAGVERIISFSVCGIMESHESFCGLGQPVWSGVAYNDYMAWRDGARYWKVLEDSFVGDFRNIAVSAVLDGKECNGLVDNAFGEEDACDGRWMRLEAGRHEVTVCPGEGACGEVFVRMLNYERGGIGLPEKVTMSVSDDGVSFVPVAVRDGRGFPNTLHDAFADGFLFDGIGPHRYVRFTFESVLPCLIDEVMVR